MKSIPCGTVTFLFTDIEGSTRLWADHPDTMKHVQVRHDTLIRQAVSDHNGYVFKTAGDQVCAAFHNAIDGLNAAVASQMALLDESWPVEIGSLKVRMGLHTGSVEQRSGDYFGLALSRIARLHSAANGGQILVSLATAELVRDQLPKNIQLRDMGPQRLKDLTRPENVFQVEALGLPIAFPPLKTLDSKPNNLPLQPTPLVGRKSEIAEAKRLLEASRLLTLTGPGGTGKTRLALQIAADVLERFPDGVYFVPISSITDPDFISGVIANALSVVETPGQAIVDTLCRHLGDLNMLLVLDNFEQVVTAAPMVSKLLESAAELKVLVTSRESLRLSGEQEYPVPSLTLPDLKRAESLGMLSQYEAVDLFIQRAQAVNPCFHLSNANAPVVAEICVRLDGLPLAIELAASRMKLISPQKLLERLGDRFQILVGSKRDLPKRQQTLRNTIDWSYDLLNDGERILFNRLGVFVRGFTLDSSEQICGSDLPINVLDGVDSLLNKSLLRQSGKADGEIRFWMLETIREYAVEHLAASPDAKHTRDKHARFFADLAERCFDLLGKHARRSAWTRWIRIIETEYENIRAALEWSTSGGDISHGFRIVSNLGWFFSSRGYYAEASLWANRLLMAKADVDPRLRGRVYFIAGRGAYLIGDYSHSEALFSRAIELARQAGHKRDEARALMMSGANLIGNSDRHQEVEERFKRALQLYEEVDDVVGISRIRSQIGDFLRVQGRFKEALTEYEAVKAISGEAWSDLLVNIGNTKKNLGDRFGAENAFRQALLFERNAALSPYTVADALQGLAAVSEDKEKAVRLLSASETIRASSGTVVEPADQAEHEAAINEVMARVDGVTFEKLSAEGRSMTMEEVVAYALDESMH